MSVGDMDCSEIQVQTTIIGEAFDYIWWRGGVRMSCRSASKGLAGILAMLLLLLCRSVGSSSDSHCSVASFPIAASSAVLVGEKRVLCAFSVTQYDPGLVLLFSTSVDAAAAAAVSVVVVVGELILLLASPVTRLGSVVDVRVPASSSTACLFLLHFFGRSSPGIYQRI